MPDKTEIGKALAIGNPPTLSNKPESQSAINLPLAGNRPQQPGVIVYETQRTRLTPETEKTLSKSSAETGSIISVSRPDQKPAERPKTIITNLR